MAKHKSQQPPLKNGANKSPNQPTVDYEEAQTDELEALKAIYMGDYSDIKSKTAWSKAADKSFKLRLHAYTDDSSFVELFVTLTATYPKSLPLLRIGDSENVSKESLDRITDILATMPRQLLGEVMAHELASSIQDVLEDATTALANKEALNAQLPSLEQERAVKEAADAKLAEERQETLLKARLEAQQEEERELQRKIDEQDQRRKEAQLMREKDLADKIAPSPVVLPDQVYFDQQVCCRNDQDEEISFRSVSILTPIRWAKEYSVFRAVPSTEPTTSLILKRYKFPETYTNRRAIVDLETTLEKLKHIRHVNVTSLLEFNVEHENEAWQFDILLEQANRGSLADILDIAGSLPGSRARIFGIEILQALDYLHRNGVVHGYLHLGSALLHRSNDGSTTIKLADAGFQNVLRGLISGDGLPSTSHSADWRAPEIMASNEARNTPKSDIWDFGGLLLNMVLSPEVCKDHTSPASLIKVMNLSEPFEDLLDDIFKSDPRTRPTAFDLTPYEFFRVDLPAVQPDIAGKIPPRSTITTPLSRRLRHESSAGAATTLSRYQNEWDEIGRLGKGGFGEVVKARNKHDGRIYAIKKITNKSPAELNQVLSEVYLLATLNHPNVVRYYNAWLEDEVQSSTESSDGMTSSSSVAFPGKGNLAASMSFGQSTGGLDFISSSGYPKIEFGYDEDDEEAVTDEDDSDGDDDVSDGDDQKSPIAGKMIRGQVPKARTYSRPATKSTLFIQMEYCERLTLRDILRKVKTPISSNPEEIWRVFRQILEGLTHIHGHGIIHRDLKPENIFIDFLNNVRIGDFGLATSGQFSRIENANSSHAGDIGMTQNIGTAFYVAPELQTNGPSSYTNKIDMYSLGIIFFEMIHHLSTGTERVHELTALREKDHTLPAALQVSERALQREILEALLSHKPSGRPTSAELLRSGKVPVQIEDETVRLALKGLEDENSPYHHKMMSALFSRPAEKDFKAHLWDMSDRDAVVPSVEFSLVQSVVKERMTAVFRRHGAVESTRQGLLPRSPHYASKNAFQLLDHSGTIVQLPYDLTLPFARTIARGVKVPEKNFTFGIVYRDPLNNGAPRSNREVDFDIVSYDSMDLALKEAEVLKTMDELIDEFPPLLHAPMCFHISSAELLQLIMEHCRIGVEQRSVVKETLGRLNIQDWTWAKIKTELRNPSIGVSSTSLDELARFDFRDAPEKTLVKLQTILAGTEFIPRLHKIFTHISGLIEYTKWFEMKRKVYISPLSSVNDRFYEGGVMFQCLFDKKKKSVVAAGGRYDGLVAAHRSKVTGTDDRPRIHAVGINIAIDLIVSSMVRHQAASNSGNAFLKKTETSPNDQWAVRRCDVLVASFDAQINRSAGIKLVSDLWQHDISAELAGDFNSLEELVSHYRNHHHSWIVTIRHESLSSARAELKVKTVETGHDYDVRIFDIVDYLRAEMRERDQREGANERARVIRQPSNMDDGEKAEVHVLVSNHKSKKTNKMRIVESARAAAQELMGRCAGAPIAAIETSSDTFEKIRETRLYDQESWRRAIQGVDLTERAYLGEVHQEILDLKTAYGDTHRTCFVFNFRTGGCILYDMRS